VNWYYTPYMIPLGIAAAIGLACIALLWRRRSGKESLFLSALLLALVWWCVTEAVRLGAQTLELKLFWARVRYVSIAAVPALWYAFVLQYTEHGHYLTRRNLLFLLIEPLLLIFFVWTNGSFHRLVWRSITLVPVGDMVGWRADHGLVFWIHFAYNYLLLAFSLFLLIQALQRSRPFYRRQYYVLLAGVSFALVINLLSVFGWTPFAYLDLTPFGFTVGGVIFVWGLLRFRLMDIIPVAYETVLDSIEAGVVVLDAGNRVVNLNRAACRILNCGDIDMTGHPADELLAAWPGVLAADGSVQETRVELNVGTGAERRYYAVEVSPLQREGAEFVGWCLVLHDVTARQQGEEALRSQKQLYESLATVAQATTKQLALEATLQNTLNIAAAISGASGGSLLILDEQLAVSHGIFTYGMQSPPGVDVDMLDHLMRNGLSGWVARHCEAVLIPDVQKDARWTPVPSQAGTRSALSLPIIDREGSLLGVLTLSHPEVGHFVPAHLALMEAAAEQMTLAWHNAQSYEEQRRLAQRLTTLYEVLRIVGGELNPKVVPQRAVEAIGRLTGWPMIAVLMPDDVGEELVVQASSSLDAVAHGWRSAVQAGIRGRAFRTGKPHYADRREDPSAFADTDDAVCSRMVIPLRRGDHLLGILDVGSHDNDAFDGDTRLLGNLLAEAISLSLDVARAHAQIGGHVADLSTLFTVSGVLSRTLVLEDLLAQMLTAVLGSAGFDTGVIALAGADGESLEFVSANPAMHPLMERLCTCAHQWRRAVAVSDAEQFNVMPAELWDHIPDLATRFPQMGGRAYVGVPLLHQERSIGVLNLLSRPPKPTLLRDIALLMALGRQIATAVVNAQLFKAIADERGRLYALIESSRDGILFVGMDRQIVVLNTRALDFLQLPESPDYWRQRDLLDMLAQWRRTASAAVVRELLAELRRIQEAPGESGTGEFELPPRILRWSHTPVLVGSTLLGHLLMLRDVTEERLLERMQQDLAHTMVHDLRNPLTGISVATKVLKRSFQGQELSAGQYQVFETLESSTQRMLNLVNAILELGRLESGEMPLACSKIRLDTLLEGVLALQSPLALEKGIALEHAFHTDMLWAWGDGVLIERVLQNLVGNAIKFTPAAGLIRVSVAWDADAAHFVISVKDTGVGVPLEVQGRLFQRFVTGNQEGRGSGLGLAFCKMVLEVHGERLWLAENSKAGATFSFTLSPAP